MRATGIVRRIDDLGRVVIPKEIRRQMGLKEGAPLEIFIDKQANAICFTPYLPNMITTLVEDLENLHDEIFIAENFKCEGFNEILSAVNSAIAAVKKFEYKNRG